MSPYRLASVSCSSAIVLTISAERGVLSMTNPFTSESAMILKLDIKIFISVIYRNPHCSVKKCCKSANAGTAVGAAIDA